MSAGRMQAPWKEGPYSARFVFTVHCVSAVVHFVALGIISCPNYLVSKEKQKQFQTKPPHFPFSCVKSLGEILRSNKEYLSVPVVIGAETMFLMGSHRS